ncbi:MULTISPECIES: multicopper oxidase domain-containing protein [unclassified Nocardia]|uniref:multicopper oxidase domain-containing protein n=1 Tax=unclassified Nocardia TaxID=2637762 RepID=UPI00278C6330|nr:MULTISPECIES: multicopper oxidase domain-containing protein [unclassified Nocardia]
MDRRTLLKSAGLAAAAHLALPYPTGVLAGSSFGQPLRDLPEIRSRDGVLDYQLDMYAQRVPVGDRVITVDTYNGQLPGPILRFRPGDEVRLLLRNLMRPMGLPYNNMPPMCAHRAAEHGSHGGSHDRLVCGPDLAERVGEGHTLPQMMIATNIHTHGLQVPPTGQADDVFLRVDPLGQHQYIYRIPADQPAGMHWYHPHFHGSTSHQAWAGLAGPLIVEGDIDTVPEIAAMRERSIVVSELWLDDNGEVPTALVVPTGGQVPFSSIPAVPTTTTFTLNGQLLPEIHMRPGETQRWRLLNAAPHRAVWLHIAEHEMHRIGQDGIPFARPKRAPAVFLSSGNRSEFIVKAGEPGRYPIINRSYDQGHPGGARPTVQLATLVVGGPTADGRIPTELVSPPVMPDLPVARRRTLTFRGDISGNDGAGVAFYIDDQLYDHDRIDQVVEAGTVEEWRIVNDDVFHHPFHIHVNPFQVIDVRGIPPGDTTFDTDPYIWWDVFTLPPKGEFTLRTYFRPDVTGKTVYHCHILPHEDNGMMGNVLIVPPGQGN